MIAIDADTATSLAWTLLCVNAGAAGVIALARWIGELPPDRRPFGPFTDVAEFLGFLDEDAPHGRVVAWLRQRGLLE